MSPEFNVLRWFGEEVINKGNFTEYAQRISRSLRDYDVFLGEPEGTYERLIAVVRDIRVAMTDIYFQFEDGAVDGDRHWARFTARGTMTGPLLGKAPTYKHAVWTEMHVARVNGQGQMEEHWGTGDELSRLQQLGLIDL
jgi:predicted ester cyclase